VAPPGLLLAAHLLTMKWTSFLAWAYARSATTLRMHLLSLLVAAAVWIRASPTIAMEPKPLANEKELRSLASASPVTLAQAPPAHALTSTSALWGATRALQHKRASIAIYIPIRGSGLIAWTRS